MANTYSDLNPDPTRETSIVVDEEAVYLELENYLNTRTGDRLFRERDGGDPTELLYELNYDSVGAFQLKSRLMTKIPVDLPRIRLVPSGCKFRADPEEHRFHVTLAFTILGLSSQEFLFDGYLMN